MGKEKLIDFYENGFEYAKDILKITSSIDDLIEINKLDEKSIIDKIKNEVHKNECR